MNWPDVVIAIFACHLFGDLCANIANSIKSYYLSKTPLNLHNHKTIFIPTHFDNSRKQSRTRSYSI